MSVSNSYQQVIAGRVREDEQVAFFGQNKLAVPSGVKQVTQVGVAGAVTPLVKDYLKNTAVGKSGARVAELDNYNGGVYQVGT